MKSMEETRQVIADQEDALTEAEEIRRLSVWDFISGANALQEANRLEEQRSEYFEELYSDIRLHKVRYSDATEPFYESPAVDAQAMEIIDAKDAYDLRIIKLKEKHRRWKVFLQLIDESISSVLIQHFEKGEKVSPHQLRSTLRMASKLWEGEEESREKALDFEAQEKLREFREQFPDLFKAKPRNRFPQLIDGEIQLMTRYEYDRFLYKEMEARLDQQFRELIEKHTKRVGQ